MPKTSLYTRRFDEKNQSLAYITKYDEDTDPLETYKINAYSEHGMVCDCPAHTPQCRHVKMMPMFDRAERGEDELYNQVTENDKYVGFLSFNGKMFDWVKGPDKTILTEDTING